VIFLWGFGGLQRIAGVRDEDDEQSRPAGRAQVLGEHVVGPRGLKPTLASAVGPGGRAGQLTADGALQDVGIDESLTMPVRIGLRPRGEVDFDGRKRLALDVRQRLLEQRLQLFGARRTGDERGQRHADQ